MCSCVFCSPLRLVSFLGAVDVALPVIHCAIRVRRVKLNPTDGILTDFMPIIIIVDAGV